MKGILLAGGAGTRLHPLTRVVSKQLLPVYDKPMVYYPLSTLMLAGIRDILAHFHAAGYAAIPADFLTTAPGGASICVHRATDPRWVGPGIHHRTGFRRQGLLRARARRQHLLRPRISPRLQRRRDRESGATIFAYEVTDPQRYGVVEFDGRSRREHRGKAQTAEIPFAVTGLYFYDNEVLDIAASLKPRREANWR